MSAGEPQSAMVPPQTDSRLPGICRRGITWCLQHRVTAGIAVVALLTYLVPSLAVALQLDYASVAAGQWWRLVTGHVTHYGGQHLFWDLLMFIVLGISCERRHPKRFGISILVMSLGISAALIFLCGDVSTYRGLSGIDTGLFVWFIGDQIRQCLAGRDRTFAFFWTAAGTLLVGKLLFEFVTGDVLFVDADGFTPLVESHVAGAALGALFAVTGSLEGNATPRVGYRGVRQTQADRSFSQTRFPIAGR